MRTVLTAAMAVASVLLSVSAAAGQDVIWTRLGTGSDFSISGAALFSVDAKQTVFVVVHDKKKKGKIRVAQVTLTERECLYRPLSWPLDADEFPIDAEALSAVPDAPEEYVILSSSGRLFHISLANGAISLRATLDLPKAKLSDNYEGFRLVKLGSGSAARTVAIWADRGEGDKPGTLHWGLWSVQNGKPTLTAVGKEDVLAPWPTGPHLRSISDVFVDGLGNVWATAASDPGDQGPFFASLYLAGALRLSDAGQPSFTKNPTPTVVARYNRKVEAVVMVPGEHGGVFVGTDDEKLGGFLFYTGKHRGLPENPDR